MTPCTNHYTGFKSSIQGVNISQFTESSSEDSPQRCCQKNSFADRARPWVLGQSLGPKENMEIRIGSQSWRQRRKQVATASLPQGLHLLRRVPQYQGK